MIESLFILNSFGEVLLEKHYRGLLSRTVTDLFWDEVQKAESHNEVKPVISASRFYLIHIQVNKLFFLAVTQQDTDTLLALEFLARFAEILKYYFGSDSPITEGVIKERFVTVYQLLDEINDGGRPFTVEANILRELIAPPSILTALKDQVIGPGENVAAILPSGALTNVYWRRANARYATNEVYFDIIESLHAIFDRNGMMSSSEVVGEVQVNCKLSGMPDLVLKFANPSALDDVALHPCVRFARWEHERIISFIPPDGEFKLMDYRCVGNIQLPFYVKPMIMYSDTGARVQITVGTKFNITDKPIEDVVITIPFSKSTSSSTLSANHGSVHFDDMTKVCRWVMPRLRSGSGVMTLEGSVNLNPGEPKPETNPTLLVDFKITMWAASGIKVDSLTMQNEKYNPYKGVRTITKGGHIQIRA